IDGLRGSPDLLLRSDFGPALSAAAAQPQVDYGDGLIDSGLAKAARVLFETDGVPAPNITVTSGAMDGVERVLRAQGLRTGARIGVEDPGHVPVHQLVRTAGMIPIPVAVDDEGVMVASLGEALDAGMDALVITPRCQNPTGASMSAERAASISELLVDHPNVVLIQDDHAGLVSGTDFHGVVPPGPRHATIRSLGKALGPDLRLALVAADTQTHERVSTEISNGPGWISHLLQRAAAHLLSDPATMKVVAVAAASYERRRNRLIDGLAVVDIAASGRSGLNVWIPTGDEQVELEAARAAGFAIRAADVYRIRSEPAVRVTISNLDDDHIDALAASLVASRVRGVGYSPSM
ncbi:MAG: aminotransferase class I/II-fold pyridoxal phosphate-dependent enzyme, partial [Acidimicrobiales bacterium]